MRITDSMAQDLAMFGVGKARERAVEAQRVAQTGVRVAKPSDDASAFARARRLASDESRLASMSKAAGDANMELQVTDGALDSAGSILARARELAVQGANGTLGPAERTGLATEIASLREGMLAIAATKHEGHYVFAGYANDSPPFDAAGVLTSDTNVREVEVAPGQRVAVSLPGGEPFAGSTDVFGVLASLEAALTANDPVATAATLADLDAATTQIASGRARVGSAMNAAQMAESFTQRLKDNARAAREQETDADVFDALSELSRAQNALAQAVEIASRLPLPNLVSQGGR